jgi:hypothetical protein
MFPLRAAALVLPLLLAGCQGTPFGDRLSASFPGGPATDTPPPRQAPAAAGSPRPDPATVPPNPAAPQPQAPRAGSPGAAAPAASPAAPPAGAAPPTAARPTAATPLSRAAATAPYRITLRLPLADPAAPAEGVTQALRAAGVPFEVETIERMNPANSPAAPEAPPGGVPAVRPAPPPR